MCATDTVGVQVHIIWQVRLGRSKGSSTLNACSIAIEVQDGVFSPVNSDWFFMYPC